MARSKITISKAELGKILQSGYQAFGQLSASGQDDHIDLVVGKLHPVLLAIAEKTARVNQPLVKDAFACTNFTPTDQVSFGKAVLACWEHLSKKKKKMRTGSGLTEVEMRIITAMKQWGAEGAGDMLWGCVCVCVLGSLPTNLAFFHLLLTSPPAWTPPLSMPAIIHTDRADALLGGGLVVSVCCAYPLPGGKAMDEGVQVPPPKKDGKVPLGPKTKACVASVAAASEKRSREADPKMVAGSGQETKKARIISIDHVAFQANVLLDGSLQKAPLVPGPDGKATATVSGLSLPTDLPNELLPISRAGIDLEQSEGSMSPEEQECGEEDDPDLVLGTMEIKGVQLGQPMSSPIQPASPHPQAPTPHIQATSPHLEPVPPFKQHASAHSQPASPHNSPASQHTQPASPHIHSQSASASLQPPGTPHPTRLPAMESEIEISMAIFKKASSQEEQSATSLAPVSSNPPPALAPAQLPATPYVPKCSNTSHYDHGCTVRDCTG